MCGIAGWVSFESDVRQNAPVVHAMTRTMALRGPDAEGIWIDVHVGLGHRRLSIIDLEGGVQPMHADLHGRSAVLTYSGEVYNFGELRERLRSHGHVFATRSDTEVVLRSYLQWGDEFVDHLNGMFAFAVWDTAKQELFLVRDRMGVKPLFYMQTADGVIFGSEAKAVLAHPQARREIGQDGFREMITCIRTPEQGVFSRINEVRPGQIVRVSRSGLTKRRYWKLEARPHEDDLEKTIETVRHLLEDIVGRQTVADVPLCSLLSGGLDSSVVTALAHRRLSEDGRGGIRSFSVDFAGSDDADPRPDLALPRERDTPFVREFVGSIGNEHEEIVLRSEALLDQGLTRRVNRARDVPTGGTIDMYPSLYRLFEEVRKSSTVALSGEAADEVFGGYNWMFDDQSIGGDTFPWLLRGRRALLSIAPLIAKELSAELDFDAFERDSYATAIAETPRLHGEIGVERRMRELGYLDLTRWLPMMLDRKDRLSMAHGLEVRVPFCDHRLVDYVFNIPWHMKTFDGHEKSILRAAFRDILPRSIVERRKSPYPATMDPAYERKMRTQVRSILRDPEDPVHALFDRDALGSLLEKPVGDRSFPLDRASLEAVNGLSVWLKDEPVSFLLASNEAS